MSREAVVGLLVSYDKNMENLRFLLSRRSEHLKQHPSQVCLPGGLVEAHEATERIKALEREFSEETGIVAGAVEWLEESWDPFCSFFGIQVYPHLGFISQEKAPEVITPSFEVNDAAWLPIDTLFRPELWGKRVLSRPLPGEPAEIRQEEVYFWNGWHHSTWGLTAAILAKFVKRISGEAPC